LPDQQVIVEFLGGLDATSEDKHFALILPSSRREMGQERSQGQENTIMSMIAYRSGEAF
jgi:hypothetical protein